MTMDPLYFELQKLRLAQKDYFKNKGRDDLIKAKQLEGKLDKALVDLGDV